MTKAKKKISAKEFDRRAEAGEDMSDLFDENSGTKRFNLDMPIWALRDLDAEADRRGQSRQALAREWIIDRLDAIKKEGLGKLKAL